MPRKTISLARFMLLIRRMAQAWIGDLLGDIGISFWERALHRKETSGKSTLNFEAMTAHLEQKGRDEDVIREMQSELLEEADQQPLLQEFRKADDSAITFERDCYGRCLVKENGQVILRCTCNSRLGALGLTYCKLEQMKSETRKIRKEYENVA